MSTTYYYAEGIGGRWIETAAKTLAGAKAAASRGQTFQGTDLFVGIKDNGGVVVRVAKKLHRDALDMNATGAWQDVEPSGDFG
jgi:hypothetical protein